MHLTSFIVPRENARSNTAIALAQSVEWIAYLNRYIDATLKFFANFLGGI